MWVTLGKSDNKNYTNFLQIIFTLTWQWFFVCLELFGFFFKTKTIYLGTFDKEVDNVFEMEKVNQEIFHLKGSHPFQKFSPARLLRISDIMVFGNRIRNWLEGICHEFQTVSI